MSKLPQTPRAYSSFDDEDPGASVRPWQRFGPNAFASGSTGADSGSGVTGLAFTGAGVSIAPTGSSQTLGVNIPGAVLNEVYGHASSTPYSLTTSFATVQVSTQSAFGRYLSPGSYMIFVMADISGCTTADVVKIRLFNAGTGQVVSNSTQGEQASGAGEFQLQCVFYATITAPSYVVVQAENSTGPRGQINLSNSRIDPLIIPSASTSVSTFGVSSLAPIYGLSGTAVVVTGFGFSSGVTSVYFGSAQSTSFVVNSDTQLTAIVPVTTNGVVTVNTVQGSASGSQLYFYQSTTPGKAPATISSANLLLLLQFLEGGGSTTADQSIYGRTFTFGSGCSWTTDAGGLPAVNLGTVTTTQITGSDANMPVGSPTMTMVVKLKANQTWTQQGGLITWGSTTNNEKAFIAANTNGSIQCPTYPDYILSGTTSVGNGGWHVVVVTVSSANATIYVDGSSIYGPSSGGAINVVAGGTTYLGYNSPVGGNYNLGLVYDYAAVWGRVLNSTEITALT